MVFKSIAFDVFDNGLYNLSVHQQKYILTNNITTLPWASSGLNGFCWGLCTPHQSYSWIYNTIKIYTFIKMVEINNVKKHENMPNKSLA